MVAMIVAPMVPWLPTVGYALTADVQVIYSFGPVGVTGLGDAATPAAALLRAADGMLYATSMQGGTSDVPDGGRGTVYRISADGSESVVYSFGGTSGAHPVSSLIQTSDGIFYGTTGNGGIHSNFSSRLGDGTVFKITASGTYAKLHDFGGTATAGAIPEMSLTEGDDGALYGVTSLGGENPGLGLGAGTFFRITSSGAHSQLNSFGASSTDGVGPSSPLVKAGNGVFYGTTARGGEFGEGTIFRVTASGEKTIVYSFGACSSDAKVPVGALIVGTDGSFYGTSVAGGQHNKGAIFRVTLSGEAAVLYSFGAINQDGTSAQNGVLEGSNGNLYGTTWSGGAHDGGTLFVLTPDGAYARLYSFGPTTGEKPEAGVIQADDGKLYGTTASGGSNGTGTVYKVTLDPFAGAPSFRASAKSCSDVSGIGHATSSGGIALSVLLTMFALALIRSANASRGEFERR